MLERHSATARLTRQMKSTEDAVAAALIESIAMMHTAAIAQRDVGGEPAMTQAVILRLNKLVGGLVSVQSETMRAHGQLAGIAREVNGPEEPTCPDKEFFSTGQAAHAA